MQMVDDISYLICSFSPYSLEFAHRARIVYSQEEPTVINASAKLHQRLLWHKRLQPSVTQTQHNLNALDSFDRIL